MKKIALALVALLPLGLAACGGDDDDVKTVTLDENAITVSYGNESKLNASEKNCTWSSENDFVASVDANGNVKANHVGTTKIMASKDGSSAVCQVTVTPISSEFVLPITAWNASMLTVKNNIPSFLEYDAASSDNEMLFYTSTGNTYPNGMPWYMYFFENDKLSGSGMALPMSANENFFDFLCQYYVVYGDSETGLLLIDNNSLSSATTSVDYSPSEDGTNVLALFIPVDHVGAQKGTRAAINDINARAAKMRQKFENRK